MARTVDPERHLARRLVIIDAALTCFAATGYAGTSTAAICREAGIGSGTFFHYFPTKQSLLLAILALGTEETRAWFDARADDADALAVVEAYVDHTAEEMSEPRLGRVRPGGRRGDGGAGGRGRPGARQPGAPGRARALGRPRAGGRAGAHRPLRPRPDGVADGRDRRLPRPARGGRGLHGRRPAGHAPRRRTTTARARGRSPSWDGPRRSRPTPTCPGRRGPGCSSPPTA